MNQTYDACDIITCVCMLSHFSCVWLFASPVGCSPKAPLSVEFSRQEYWSGLFLLQIWLYLATKEEKAMAPHSSTLVWKIPWMEEPRRLQFMRLWRVGHDWATSLSLFTFMHWRRKWQPSPAFFPGESQGWGSLVGCHLWGRTESDMTEAT